MHDSLQHRWRTYRAAAWLGYQMEANWTRPDVFLIFALAKPLATGLILLVMYSVVSGGHASDPRFVALYVGNAFFVFVPLLLVGLSWAVFEDREQFQMLKYVVTTPAGLLVYLLGRAVTKGTMAVASVVALLLFGVFVLHMPLHLTPVRWLVLLATVAVGIVSVIAIGLMLAGSSLVFARQAMSINEGAASVLYLFCGAVFPPDLLPAPLRGIGYALPLTYWLEACRRVLIGPSPSGMLGELSDLHLALAQVGSTLVWLVLGVTMFRALLRAAQRDGKIDQTTAW